MRTLFLALGLGLTLGVGHLALADDYNSSNSASSDTTNQGTVDSSGQNSMNNTMGSSNTPDQPNSSTNTIPSDQSAPSTGAMPSDQPSPSTNNQMDTSSTSPATQSGATMSPSTDETPDD